jgi:hypothetical protein
MSDAAPAPAFARARHALFILATLATFLGNVIPLYGVLYWQWDTFQLLMLYWMETCIVAFWTLKRLARLPVDALGTMTVNGQVRPASRTGLVGFFALHASAFILVHLLFLWIFFSSAWLKKVHGVGSFFAELFLENGLWSALLFMFVAGWVTYLTTAKPDYAHTIDRKVYPRRLVDRKHGGDGGDAVGPIVGALYMRIVIMQVAIIFGAMLSQGLGSTAPLLLVIGLKTLIDLGLGPHLPFIKKMDFSSNKISIET